MNRISIKCIITFDVALRSMDRLFPICHIYHINRDRTTEYKNKEILNLNTYIQTQVSYNPVMSTQEIKSVDSNCFVNTGKEKTKSSKLLLDLITKRLEQKWMEIKSERVKQIGKGLANTIRPWSLVFIRENDASFEEALLEKAVMIHQGHPDAEPSKRVWFNSIQVCRINSTHQLRGVLSALHVNSTKQQEETAANKSELNIVDWMIEEKDNQPPSLIVVIDLIDLIISKLVVNHSYSDPLRYLHLPFNELSLVLANLLETCEYQSTIAKRHWEYSLDLQFAQYNTKLLLTDSGCLPPQKAIADFGHIQKSYTEKIYQILHYYIDRLV